MTALIDTHSHLDAAEFAADRAQVIIRARLAGVDRQILPAVSAASWPNLRVVAAAHVGLHAAYGLHPMFLDEHQPQHIEQLAQWLERERPIAVGEAGLDYFVDTLDRVRQQHYFEEQLALARQFELPVILHARRAVDAVISGIRRCKPPGGVIHSYAGSVEQAGQLEKLGFKLGFGGPLTYPRARRLRELVTRLPLSQLLIETDAPDQPLSGRQGQRNEPALLVEVLQTLAQLRTMPPAEMAQALNANAVALFGPRLAVAGDSGATTFHSQPLQ
jgi:TatD DNase family protein